MASKSFRSIIEKISFAKSSPATVFADFCTLCACAFAAGTREEEYLEVIRPYSKEELNLLSQAMALLIQEMEEKPFTDILGPYYIEVASHSSKQARGEFYTPPELSKAMVKMIVDSKQTIEKGRPITVSDPCCGSGGMVLALAEEFAPTSVDLLRVTCQDINPVATNMCFINTTLWGIPAHVVQGDSLRMTVDRTWKNVHWMRVGEDTRQAIQKIDHILARGEQEAAPEDANHTEIQSSSSDSTAHIEQIEFNLAIDGGSKSR